MSEIEEDSVGFEVTEKKFNFILCFIHGYHDEWEQQRVRHIVSGLGARREAVNVRNGDGNKGDEVGKVIEMLNFGLCSGWDKEGDFVASFG